MLLALSPLASLCVFQDEISFSFIAKELVEGLMIRVCYRYDFPVVQTEKVIFGEDAIAGFRRCFLIFPRILSENPLHGCVPFRQKSFVIENFPDVCRCQRCDLRQEKQLPARADWRIVSGTERPAAVSFT